MIFRRLRRTFAFGLLLLTWGGGAQAVESLIALRIASEGARPPFNYFEGSKLTGFEIELGRELCARMQRVCVFVAQDWDNLVPGLLAEAPHDPAYFGEGVGIGLRKDDAALKAAFDRAIDEVVGDGTFAKIRAKYFDFEIY